MIPESSTLTIAALRASMPRDKAQDIHRNQWPVHYLVLPVSWPVSLPFVRMGIPPNLITAGNGLVMMVLPLAFLLPGQFALWVTAIGLYLFQLLDCVDGIVARYTKSSSKFGAILDSTVDQFSRMAGYLTIALLAFSRPEYAILDWDVPLLAMGLLAAWLAAAAKLIRAEHQAEAGGGSILNAPETEQLSAGDRLLCFLTGLDYLTFAFVPIFALAGLLDGFLAWLLLYSAADYGLTLFLVARKGQ